jgi:subtilisin-like proprotein convertase family protein
MGMRAALAGLLTLLLTTPAGADTLSATRGQKVTETRHEVRIRVRDGVATYRVRRTFRNAGKRHDEGVLDLGMPFGAAATGLRIKTPSGWYAGELMRAERAARMYEKLTGIGPHIVKDPALLQWRWANELQLRVFPIAPGAESTIEYTLTGPTRYQGGRYVVSYPMASDGMADPQLRVRGHDAAADVWLNGEPIAGEVKLSRPEVPSWATDQELPASYAFSEIPVGDFEATKLTVTVDVRHTYRGDLRVQLVPPSGPWRTLHDQANGSENDVRQTAEIELSKKEPVSVKGTWRLLVSDHAALDVGTIDGWSITLDGGDKKRKLAAADTPKFIPDAPSGQAGHMGVIQVAPPPIRDVAARLGRVEAAKDKHFLRLEIDTAPELRPLPKRLHVVFVVDASKSVPSGELGGQLSVLRSYLRNAPKAKVEVVLYRRFAERLFGEFVPAADVPARLKKAEAAGKLALGNGSALDEGVRAASAALRKQRGTRAIVMMTDDLLRPSWTNDRALKLLAAAPIRHAHVVLPAIHHGYQGSHRDRRDDGHHLSPLASKNGGVLLHIDSPLDENKELDDVTLGLVRPIRIDQFQVHGVKFPDEVELPAVLHEGEGIRQMVALPKAPSRVRLTGKIWAQPFSRVVRGPLRFSQATAAFVFSHDLHKGLSEDEMVRVAFAGKAVSPVTSYLAVEPGVRPSRVGFEGLGEGAGGLGAAFGVGGYSTVGHGAGSCPAYSIEDDVAKAAKACIAAHAPSGKWTVKLKVHTTFDEVVDVVPVKRSKLSTCLAEAVWTAELSSCQFTAMRDEVTATWP